ncbi:hypothetical protein BO71DRAFT_399176 [Aspergillus ellipticus CBS 707.79]|uniref:Uncharacterized protein n=1 Tax=Aspergillus ellipticus CBS 707.79 TaxID=1448320 RepID=A0A319DAG2_9EURO|nr:hypothetical protein BO71DRAFT_399176 [Aspergillus ellipticus CBS 707.79]
MVLFLPKPAYGPWLIRGDGLAVCLHPRVVHTPPINHATSPQIVPVAHTVLDTRINRS